MARPDPVPAASGKVRLDQYLVEHGLAESRAKAQAAIDAGGVTVNGTVARKASAAIPPDAVVTAEPAHPWVSRGGVKLAAALDAFGIDPAGRFCLDVGASTGGFSEVLLARGAAHVTAIDVGHGQLHPRLNGHPRLTLHEGVDARALSSDLLAQPPSLITIDVSFIGLAAVLPAVLACASGEAVLIALVKPQFEAGRADIRKGVVRDAAVHARVVGAAQDAVAALGWQVIGTIPSPITGGDGNVEFLLGARRGHG